jgi:predicted amidophosphoribosyltransferase
VVRENGKGLEADVIVPVPPHKIRWRERGFNQAEMLSKRLAKRLKLPHQGVLLVRIRPRPDKHLLTSDESWRRFVLLLPHVQAAKLTSCASYW